jgi:uncharacterized protein DUF4190
MTYPPPPGSGDYVPPSSDPAAPPVYPPPPSYEPPPAYQPPGFAAPAYPPYPQQSDPAQQPPGFPPGPGYPQQPDPAQPFGYQQPGDQAYPNPAYQQGYANPYGYSPYPAKPPQDGLAIAALVVSCVAVLGLCGYGIGGLLGVVGAVLGHVSRRRIKATGAGGEGMALAGIIVGWIAAGIGLLIIAGIVIAIVASGDYNS